MVKTKKRLDGKEKIRISHNGKRFYLSVSCVSGIGFVRGLMFRKLENTENLFFEFNKDVGMKIHSFFVWFPFVALWLDSHNKVVGWKIVKPWEFNVGLDKKFRKLIEIPICGRNKNIFKIIVGKQKV